MGAPKAISIPSKYKTTDEWLCVERGDFNGQAQRRNVAKDRSIGNVLLELWESAERKVPSSIVLPG